MQSNHNSVESIYNVLCAFDEKIGRIPTKSKIQRISCKSKSSIPFILENIDSKIDSLIESYC